ncbi:MAG: hypothetical protein JST51_01425 [Armatimonadetes bacterium]|nr:hypothetical protein [Armatimonadota bacterium]
MTYAEVKTTLEAAEKPTRARRSSWPSTDYAAFDGDDIERYDADGHPSFLTDEDLAADDWSLTIAIPYVGEVE